MVSMSAASTVTLVAALILFLPVEVLGKLMLGLLIGTPTNAALDIAVLVVAAVLGVLTAAALLRRLVR